jgi:DNA-binding NarL/FixJ family response regulator
VTPDADAPQQVRVLVGEDQPFVREGIVRVLQEGGFDVVGTAADARELVQMDAAFQPDVIIADIQMPPGHADDGLRAALAIRAARPGAGVLVLSQFLEDAYAFDLVADGAQGVGYLLKEKVGDLGVFTDAVRRVADGGSVLDPDVVARLVGRTRKASPLDDLTPRERQVLGLIAEGRSNAGIAQELVVTVAAVERHVTGIFEKLGLHRAPDQHRRVLAVLKYLQAGTAS